MTIFTRSASPADFARIDAIFRAAFGKEDESDLWSYLIAHDSLLALEDVHLALEEGQPMAVTLIQRRPIQTRQGWAPGAIVNLVACDPAAQKKGYGSAAMQSALAQMVDAGLAAGILYGVAEYYPRFGFVPVLPTFRTEVPVDALHAHGEARLRPVASDDLPAVAALYSGAYDHYPCNIQRSADAPLWNVRAPEQNAVVVLPDRTGYAFITRASDHLYVHEAAATDTDAGRRLLAGLGGDAIAHGVEKVVFNLPPDHLLTRMLSLGTYKQTRAAAKHGMVIVTDWAQVLPSGYTVSDEGLLLDGRLAVVADRRTLTGLVMGYRCADDLSLMPGVTVVEDAGIRSRLAADFPPTFPKWSLDPFWEGA